MDEITNIGVADERKGPSLNARVKNDPGKSLVAPRMTPKAISKASTAVASPSLSKSSTLDYRDERNSCEATSTILPKHERRGFLSRTTLISERREPKEYIRSTKWFITFIVAAAAAIVTTGENIFYPSLQDTASNLNSSLNLTDLSLSLSKIGIALCPLWWSVLSEHSGRRTVYILSFLLFVLWSVLSALSNSIGMLIAMRILAASAASSVQSVGAGTVADIWEVKERGTAMGIFYVGQLAVGTLLGPLLGGVLTQVWGWRATQWFLALYGGVVLLLIVSCLPETSPRAAVSPTTADVASKNTDLEKVQESDPPVIAPAKKSASWVKIMIEPFNILTYLRFTALTTTIYIASITFGTLGILNISIQDTFSSSPYNLSTIVIGCLYIPIGSGNILGSVFGGKWSDFVMHREARKAQHYDSSGNMIYHVEDRVRENAWLAVVGYAGMLVFYGWVVEKGVHWIVPMLAGFLTGLSSMVLFGLVTTMCTELMPKKPASAVALNSMGRNLFACVGFAIAQPLINVMGNGWLFTAAGAIMLVTGLIAVGGLQKYGAQWRESMGEK